jgi:hypothetical protein
LITISLLSACGVKEVEVEVLEKNIEEAAQEESSYEINYDSLEDKNEDYKISELLPFLVEMKGEKGMFGMGPVGEGFMDMEGNVIIQPDRFVGLAAVDDGFYDGLAAIRDFKTDLYGLINEKGQWVIEPIYSDLYTGDGTIYRFVKGDYTSYGFIDRQGNNLFDKEFASAGLFIGDYAWVLEREGDYSSAAIINRQGEVVFRSKREIFDLISENGLVRTRKIEDGKIKYGIIDFKDRVILSEEYDEMGKYHNKKVWVIKDNHMSVVDEKGKTVFDYEDDVYNVSYFEAQNKGYYRLTVYSTLHESKYFLLDENGKAVFDRSYDWISVYPSGIDYCDYNDKEELIGKIRLFESGEEIDSPIGSDYFIRDDLFTYDGGDKITGIITFDGTIIMPKKETLKVDY